MGRVLQSNGGDSSYFAASPQSDSNVVEIEATRWNLSVCADLRFALAVLAEANRTIEDKGLHFISRRTRTDSRNRALTAA